MGRCGLTRLALALGSMAVGSTGAWAGGCVCRGDANYAPTPAYNYYAPPAYYAPPPVYYAPPPVYYAPPRAYYGPPAARGYYAVPPAYGYAYRPPPYDPYYGYAGWRRW